MNKFKVGQKVSTRSICNYDCIYEGVIVRRTAKTVWFKEYNEVKSARIQQDDNHYNGDEFIYPHGRHSMCPVFVAGKTV